MDTLPDINISVCIATYNGEKYLEEQIHSITPQLLERDEIIIVDDASNDRTIDIINELKANNKKIKLLKNSKNLGHVKSFELAIKKAKGDYIFLSDQDDIWAKNKVKEIKASLNKKTILVATDFEKFDNLSNYREKIILPKSNKIYNVLKIFFGKIFYYGCTMAFPKEFKQTIIPFPKNTEMHDIWIALAANFSTGEILHLNKVTLHHRIHDHNKTPKYRRSLLLIFKTRLIMITHSMRALSMRFNRNI